MHRGSLVPSEVARSSEVRRVRQPCDRGGTARGGRSPGKSQGLLRECRGIGMSDAGAGDRRLACDASAPAIPPGCCSSGRTGPANLAAGSDALKPVKQDQLTPAGTCGTSTDAGSCRCPSSVRVVRRGIRDGRPTRREGIARAARKRHAATSVTSRRGARGVPRPATRACACCRPSATGPTIPPGSRAGVDPLAFRGSRAHRSHLRTRRRYRPSR